MTAGRHPATLVEREEWDAARLAGVVPEAAALGIPVLRSSVTPWRTAYIIREYETSSPTGATIVLGDAARFEWHDERAQTVPHRPHGLTHAETVRRETLLDVRELVHARMAHVDPQARARRDLDELERRLYHPRGAQ